MILTGVAARAVAYEYYTASLAAAASYTITQNGVMACGSTTALDNNTNLNLECSGDSGSNWKKSNTTTPNGTGFAANKNYTRIRNATAGGVAVSVTGVYWA